MLIWGRATLLRLLLGMTFEPTSDCSGSAA
jgi:hypothetical protein